MLFDNFTMPLLFFNFHEVFTIIFAFLKKETQDKINYNLIENFLLERVVIMSMMTD